jgi:hypothetical protein
MRNMHFMGSVESQALSSLGKKGPRQIFHLHHARGGAFVAVLVVIETISTNIRAQKEKEPIRPAYYTAKSLMSGI